VTGQDEADVSGRDELPLWSAPFGLALLEAARLAPGLTVLDVGSGTGFPALELAERLGPSGRVCGVDPSPGGVARGRAKARAYETSRIVFARGVAERLPLRAGVVDLVVSNNGFNNVADRGQAFRECRRVCRDGAQLLLTMNLAETMKAFYDELRGALLDLGLAAAVPAVEAHIRHKRPPLDEVEAALAASGFRVLDRKHEAFSLRFLDRRALYSHHLIRHGFLPAWREAVPPDRGAEVFRRLEQRLDAVASARGELRLDVPFVLLEARAA